jgi:pimeloyl-ACP methyl ester carboxylesterase
LQGWLLWPDVARRVGLTADAGVTEAIKPWEDTTVNPLCSRSNIRQAAVVLGAALYAIALLPCPSIAQSFSDLRPSKRPLVLAQQGSFFVGGRHFFSDAAGWDLIGLLGQFGTDDVTVDQMYVQFQVPVSRKKHVPLVFVHGCCLTSKTWETTPDGRMGWYEYFTRNGYPTYLAEQSGRARSGFNGTIYNEVKEGLQPLSAQPPVLIAGAQFAWSVFRFGPSFGVAWPDEQFPMDKVEELYKQVIPDLILTEVPNLLAEFSSPTTNNPTVVNMAALARQLGGAILIGHSQSSGFPTQATLKDATGVRGIIGLETGCFGNLDAAQIATLATVPILIVVGDHQAPPPPPASCATEMQQVNAAGGDMTFISLPDVGLHGNSHMMMQDRNNLQVADVLLDWIDQHVEQPGGHKHH